MHISESHIIPYSATGVPISNFHSRFLKFWFQNIFWKNPNMTDTQGLCLYLNYFSWTHINNRYNRLNFRDPIVYAYSIFHNHWPYISWQSILRTYHCIMHQHGNFCSNQFLDGALWCPVLRLGARPTKHYLFLFIHYNLHKIWVLEDPIFSVVFFDHQYWILVSLSNISLSLMVPVAVVFTWCLIIIKKWHGQQRHIHLITFQNNLTFPLFGRDFLDPEICNNL